MPRTPNLDLPRRERQIMNALFRRQRASVKEIAEEIPDPPSETAIRTFLRILQEKGYVKRERDGRRHIYRPAVSRTRAARKALAGVLGTFFEGSLGDAVAAHLADPSAQVDEDELERLRELIESARKERP